MTFERTTLLWLLALVPFVLMFLVSRERWRGALARRFVSERLRGVSNTARPLRPYLAALAAAGTFIALAGPRAGFTIVKVEAPESNRVIVVDVSQSMAARDLGTSRLDAAKAVARRIIDAHAGRIALVVFESRADVIAPLTSDTEAVAALLDTIAPGEVGEPGSDIGAAITAARRLLGRDPGQKGDVVIISDGEDQGGKVAEAAKQAKEEGVVISAILVGSGEGSTIPDGQGALHDDSGQVVMTYARSDNLATIARTTGGIVVENPFAARALDPLLAMKRGGPAKPVDVRIPVDRYQWPLAVAFAAFLCGSLANRGAE
jgi:Ca-activated chloride channel family protein